MSLVRLPPLHMKASSDDEIATTIQDAFRLALEATGMSLEDANAFA